MNFLLFPRVVTSACVDLSLAVLVGLLLAALWLRGRPEANVPSLRLAALVLLVGSGVQMCLLTAACTGQMSFAKNLAAFPDVCAMHSGRVVAAAMAVALLLFAFTLIPWARSVTLPGGAVLVAVCIAVHSANGHAAVDGDFSLAEWLQIAHLGAMAVWSGGILVSGLLILPRLAGLGGLRAYLGSLSTASTWSVGIVLLSGAVKSWRQIGGDLKLLPGSGWAYLLGVKIVFVTVAVVLGGLNRLHLRKPAPWSAEQDRRAVGLLRFEAVAMAAILILSAWLGNVSPPGE